MAKERIVNVRFWRDNYVAGLKPEARLLFLWAITNPATELCGAYEAPLSTVELETGLKRKRILEIFAEFHADGRMLYRDGWVIIKNFAKHQHGTSKNIKAGIARTLNDCPDWVKDTVSKGIHTVSHLDLDSVRQPRPKPIPSGGPAPPPAPVSQSESKTKHEDPRKSHPAIVAIREITERYPPKEIWDEIIDQIGINGIDQKRLRKCFVAWIGRGYNKTNFDWAFDWYVNNRIPKAGERNGKIQQHQNSSNRQTAVERIADHADILSEYPTEAELRNRS